MSIVVDVKARGFDAVREWAMELDGVEPARAEPIDEGLPAEAILTLADRVRRWHEAQRPPDIALEIEPGVILERRWVALDTVGVYVPRGLISTLVMCAVPAQTAGVRRIVVCTPPDGAGLVAAAARLLGLEEVWALGGPQAIGFLAYVERVDKIVGPGNAYVNEAKLEVAATVEEAEAIAPEHLVLLGEAEAAADRIRNAGSIFVGPWSPVPAGDYATGANHVLPTNGWARSVGGLGLETFHKPVTVQRLTREGLELVRPTVDALAAAEGMPAHAAAVRR